MQDNTNNIQKMVADAVHEAVAPLYSEMREIEEKYYPDMNKQEPQQPEDEAPAFDVSRFKEIYEKSGRLQTIKTIKQ